MSKCPWRGTRRCNNTSRWSSNVLLESGAGESCYSEKQAPNLGIEDPKMHQLPLRFYFLWKNIYMFGEASEARLVIRFREDIE